MLTHSSETNSNQPPQNQQSDNAWAPSPSSRQVGQAPAMGTSVIRHATASAVTSPGHLRCTRLHHIAARYDVAASARPGSSINNFTTASRSVMGIRHGRHGGMSSVLFLQALHAGWACLGAGQVTVPVREKAWCIA